MLGVRIPPGLPAIFKMNAAETIKSWTETAKQFYAETRSEMKKVSWPNRQEVISTTIVVMVAVAIFGVFFFVVDTILGQALNWVLRHYGVTTGG
ncbi:MAG TPA: preprotein translocase subunit SecE [Terriglobia bacterium]